MGDKGMERINVDECQKRLPKRRRSSAGGPVAVGGVVVDLYQFKDTPSVEPKLGKFFQTTSMARFDYTPANGVALKGDNKGSECKFWIHDTDDKVKLEKMICRSMRLKHHAILKPVLCNENPELSKMVTACAVYTETFVNWLAKQVVKSSGDYLSDEEKDIIISLWNALEELWEKGCTSDQITQLTSYVMVSQRIKILPFIIRDQQDGDDKMALRTQLANFLRTNFSPIWNNDEFNEFIDLIEDPNASSQVILGHPVLLSHVKRQAMYRPMCSTKLTKAQCNILNKKITGTFDWKQLAKSDDVLSRILQKNQFTQDGEGACYLGRIVSCHYTQHMRAVDKEWYEKLEEDTVDKWLKINLPLVLCRRYALTCDPDFIAAGKH